MAFNKEEKKIWYIKNREKILKHYKKYYLTNIEQFELYRELHRKERLEYMKQYYQINKEKMKLESSASNEHQRKYQKKRRKNINYRLLDGLRNRIYYAIKKNYKSIRTLKLLGCSIETLKRHLELKFKQGMSFSNYGKWHIDHIRPCASFDLSKPKEQHKCFHYTNLQPLWAKENLEKHDKIIKSREVI
jgi:hypothetical protein